MRRKKGRRLAPPAARPVAGQREGGGRLARPRLLLVQALVAQGGPLRRLPTNWLHLIARMPCME